MEFESSSKDEYKDTSYVGTLALTIDVDIKVQELNN